MAIVDAAGNPVLEYKRILYFNEEVYATVTEYTLGECLLKNGCVGTDVKELQEALIRLGISCGDYGADGGSATARRWL